MIEARSHKNCEGKAELERVSHHITALGQFYSKLSIADTVEAVAMAPQEMHGSPSSPGERGAAQSKQVLISAEVVLYMRLLRQVLFLRFRVF